MEEQGFKRKKEDLLAGAGVDTTSLPADNGLAQCLAEGLKGPAYQPVKTSYVLLD